MIESKAWGEPDLSTEKGILAYIEASDSMTDLRARCQRILEANNYRLPAFYHQKVIISGVLRAKEIELLSK